MEVITRCPLCGVEKSLHSIQGELSQCLSCGYVTSDKFLGTKETCDGYKKLPDQMKDMAVEKNNQVWIPTVMTLPTGVLNPILVEGNMFWAYSPAEEIPEHEQKNFPDGQGGFYTKRYNETETKLFTHFGKALLKISESDKSKSTKLKLPKLKKTNAKED